MSSATVDTELSPAALFGRALGKVAFAGAVTGLLIGGVGGRLAMFVLRLTSSDTLVGVTTDDGFTIGRFTTETLFLLGATAFLGVVGALLYAAGRTWFPPAWRPWAAASFAGLIIGADLVSAEGIDFRLLDPLLLAIVMFVAIPFAYGLVMATWVERWLANERTPSSPVVAVWPLVGFLGLGPFGIVPLLVVMAGWSVVRLLPALARAWRSAPAVWAGRALFAVACVMGAVQLVRDSVEVLG